LAQFFWFNSVFSVWLGFFLGFFLFEFGSVWFFLFQAYKTETEPVGFFKILIGLIGFFHSSVFLVIFFWFSWFSRFFNFSTHPLHKHRKMKNVYQNQKKPHIVVSMSYLKVMEHAKNSWGVASSNRRWREHS
jgi:hypothetical protein